MRILSLEDLPIEGGSCITIGGFDGVHLGHQELIKEVKYYSETKGIHSVLVTFDIPPQVVLKGWDKGLLTPIEEKLMILKEYNLDFVLILKFDEKLKNMEAKEFIEEIMLKKLHAKAWVLGHNHHFGKGREGNAIYLIENIKKWPFFVTVVPPILWEGEAITSSLIREECLKGRIERTNKFLGRPYFLYGKVVHGDGRGHLTGIPTANIEVNPLKLLPKRGTYASFVHFKEKRLRGVTNIGVRPTFGGDRVIPEIHVLDFEGNLYGENLKVELIEYLREEVKFNSLSHLKKQIEEDIKRAREMLI